ncbi:MAG: SLC13 family permease, partial [Longimicrobiales bacterium]|nr:SLC13 family permease [Longimicrobiales bacterium]
MGIQRRARGNAKRVGFWLGMLAFFLLLVFPVDGGNPPASRMAAVALLMAIWWVSDCIPLFATALIPLVLFPLLGIMAGRETAPIYFNNIIVLFIGGFMIALTMEKWNLHKRIALAIIHAVGGGPARMVLGFMLAAAFLSMWISNTATAVMMVPIGLAMILQIEEEFGKDRAHSFSVGLMLGIAYSCSVGGLMTLVGTPPNLSFVRIFQILFPEAPAISFGQWMTMALPLGVVLLAIAWALITRVFYRAPSDLKVDREAVTQERAALGPVTFEEKVVMAVFATTAILWVFRVDLQLGMATLPGWSRLLPYPEMIDDGTVAIAMASILFFIPTRDRSRGDLRVMGPDVIPRLPWNSVLLFGGGFALAAGFQRTGLAQLKGEQ